MDEAHHTGNPWIYLEVKRSKVKVMPINVVTDNAPYSGWGIKIFLIKITYLEQFDVTFLLPSEIRQSLRR